MTQSVISQNMVLKHNLAGIVIAERIGISLSSLSLFSFLCLTVIRDSLWPSKSAILQVFCERAAAEVPRRKLENVENDIFKAWFSRNDIFTANCALCLCATIQKINC